LGGGPGGGPGGSTRPLFDPETGASALGTPDSFLGICSFFFFADFGLGLLFHFRFNIGFGLLSHLIFGITISSSVNLIEQNVYDFNDFIQGIQLYIHKIEEKMTS
jgi:hypothetical protein